MSNVVKAMVDLFREGLEELTHPSEQPAAPDARAISGGCPATAPDGTYCVRPLGHPIDGPDGGHVFPHEEVRDVPADP